MVNVHDTEEAAKKIAHRGHRGVAPAKPAPHVEGPSLPDEVMGGVEKAGSLAGNLMMIPFAGGLASVGLRLVGGISKLTSLGPLRHIGTPFDWAGEKTERALEALGKVTVGETARVGSTVLEKSANAVGAGSFSQGLKSASTAVKGVEEAAIGIAKSAGEPVLKATASALETVGAKGVANSTRSLAGTLGKMPVMHVAGQGMLAASTAVTAYGTAKDLGSHTHALKTMYADITGKDVKDVHLSDITSGNAPEIMKEARTSFMKTFGPQALTSAVGIGTNVAFMRGGSMSKMKLAAAIFVPMAASMIGNLISGGKPGMAQVYTALKTAHEQGADIAPQDYAMFISSVNKDASASGGEENRLVQGLAMAYAKDKAAPIEIIREMQNGKFDERAATMQAELKEHDAQMKLAKLHTPETTAKPVVGKNTERELKRREHAHAAHAAGVA